MPIPLTSFSAALNSELSYSEEIFARNGVYFTTYKVYGAVEQPRLSIHLGGQLIDRYADGVWWIETGIHFRYEQLVGQERARRRLAFADSQSDSAEESIIQFFWPT
jgi:hypothetical protein